MIETGDREKRDREREPLGISENLREFYNLHSYLTIRQRRFMYIG